MYISALAFAAVVVGPAVAAVALVPAFRRAPFASFGLVLASHYFFFLCVSAAFFNVVPFGALKLLISTAVAAAYSIAAVRILLPRLEKALDTPYGPRRLALVAALAALSVAPDAVVHAAQGFSTGDRTGNFAAPYAGDHWRHTSIVAGLRRESASVFFPNSELVYQVLWHHGTANVVAVLPDRFTIYPYELGASLFTGALLYFFLYWIVGLMRPDLLARPLALGAIVLLAACDADLYNAGLSYWKHGEVALAADASARIPSVFRYFSIKLVTMTAPQHAAFFVYAGIFLLLARRGAPIGTATAFLVPATVLSPILAVLTFPVLGAVLFVQALARRTGAIRVAASMLAAAAAAFAAHWAVLRFSMLDLFFRPNLTGGGSGQYGLKFAWTLPNAADYAKQSPVALVAMIGVPGAIVTVLVAAWLFRNRTRFAEPAVATLLIGAALWNFLVVDTEIQRHFSMVAAFLAVVVSALFVPARGPRRWRLATAPLVAAGLLAAVLGGFLVRAYRSNQAFMPLTVPWPDYFRMNDKIARGRPNLPVVVCTPKSFELPIASEATTALVWSQIAAVHQRLTADAARLHDRVYPRDWDVFRREALADDAALVRDLGALGFHAIVWGPIEEREWGRAVRERLLKSDRFVDACGLVALYALDDGEGAPRPAVGAALAHAAFIRRLESGEETLFSAVRGVDLRMIEASVTEPAPDTINVAPGTKARMSKTEPGYSAGAAIDGNADANGMVTPLAYGANDFCAWWQLDLRESRDLDVIRVFHRTDDLTWRAHDFYVLVSETPFVSKKLYPAGVQPGVTVFFQSGPAADVTTIPVGRRGRYVRIQRTDLGHLVLAEVQVWARP